MRLSEVLLLIGVALSATRACAQPLPELPPPRPVAPGQPLPQLPQPRLVPPLPPGAPAPRLLLPPLARQALASNHYKPVCEPETPTHGVWGDTPCPHQPSWQECWMSVRDCLAWICTRPTCAQGMRPPSNASLYDWLCNRLWFHTGSQAAFSAPRTMRVMTSTAPAAHP